MATVKTVWNRAQEEYEAAQSARREYAPGERVTQLAEQLESYAAATPQAYQSPYQQQIAELAGRIADRTFSYDLLSDPVYRQYRSQYQRLGRRAMEDTVGTASALTGGYGSSYAVTAGQQGDYPVYALEDMKAKGNTVPAGDGVSYTVQGSNNPKAAGENAKGVVPDTGAAMYVVAPADGTVTVHGINGAGKTFWQVKVLLDGAL